MKVKYALPGEEQRKEMEAISTCWATLSKLDSHARSRVIDWLQSWAHSEKPDDEKDF